MEKTQAQNFEVENGLLGMMRGINLKLIAVITTVTYQHDKVKAILGMCDETLDYRNHYYFKKIMNDDWENEMTEALHEADEERFADMYIPVDED
jgi:hypothetical protein